MLVSQDPGYALMVDADQVDGSRFLRIAAEGRRLLDAGQALVTRRPNARHRPRPSGAERSARISPPQLERLQARIDSAVTGRGGTVVLVGEPGVGKTTLAEQGAEESEREANPDRTY